MFGTGTVTLGGVGSTGALSLHAVGNGIAGSADRTVSNDLIVSNAGSNTTIGLQTTNGGSSITWNGNIELQRDLLLTRTVSGVPNAFGKFTLAGTISGAGGLVLEGLGNMTRLSGPGTFSGGVTVNSGTATLELGSATALGTGTLTVNASANGFQLDSTVDDLTLTTNNAIALNNSLTYLGTDGNNLNLGTGTVTLSAGNKTITTTDGVLTIGGAIIGTSGQSLFKEGAGTLVLNGANNYGATEGNAGTLRGDGSLAGGLYLNASAIFEAGGGIGTFTVAEDV